MPQGSPLFCLYKFLLMAFSQFVLCADKMGLCRNPTVIDVLFSLCFDFYQEKGVKRKNYEL